MSTLKLKGSTSGYVELTAPATAGDNTITLPTGSGTVVVGDGSGNITITGVTTVSAGSTSAPSITPSGDPNTGVFFPSADTIAFAEGGAEAARIDSSGRLLLGTSTAIGNDYWGSGKFQVSGTGGTAGIIQGYTYNDSGSWSAALELHHARGSQASPSTSGANDRLGEIIFYGYNSAAAIPFQRAASIHSFVDGTPSSGGDTTDMPGALIFSTTADGASSPTERMRIAADGMTGMFSANDSLQTRNSNGAGTTYAFIRGIYSATGTVTGGTTSFIVYSNGNVENTNNSYTAISDIKLKENIVDANSQWSDIKALQVRNYNFKEGQTHTQIGLIAQEVELVSPGLVTESPDRDEEGNDLGTVTKSVNYSVLYMKAVKALQEAQERIESLESENSLQAASLAALDARLSALESA